MFILKGYGNHDLVVNCLEMDIWLPIMIHNLESARLENTIKIIKSNY